MDEMDVICPFCGETIPILVDTSVDEQTYIEDCSVCCKPIQFHVKTEDGEVTALDASAT